jgi:hypothetical protein
MKQHIKIVREFNQWRTGKGEIQLGADYPTQLSHSLDEVVKAAERYEFMRTLNVPEFKDLFNRNISGEGRFDDLVDEAMKERK